MSSFTNEAPLDKRKLEVTWADQQAHRTLTKQDLGIWKACSSAHRVYLSPGYKLVHWRLLAGQPTIISNYILEEVVTGAKGTRYLLGQNLVKFQFTHKPSLLPDTDIFIWVPYFNELRHKPDGEDFLEGGGHTSVSLCIKQRSNPIHNPTPGHDYFTTLQEFQRGV